VVDSSDEFRVNETDNADFVNKMEAQAVVNSWSVNGDGRLKSAFPAFLYFNSQMLVKGM